jgi:predicted dehydrogenase
MDAGLHVLCEKLMARTVPRCKDMINHAYKTGMLLNIGHQRHYSTLYAHAHELVQAGILGDIKHIKAQWPRNNSYPFVCSEEDKKKYDLSVKDALPYYNDGWCKPVLLADSKAFKPEMTQDWGFRDIEQLVRWRLYDNTGGGLMAELGSHQLDASSIFLGHVHPIAVSGVGGKFFYGPGRNDRESDDGIFVNFEFPGPKHPKAGKGGNDPSDIVVVSYTSFNTNSYEKYGECLMGSRGTMVVEMESDIYLFKEPDKNKKETGTRDTKITITGDKKPVAEASSTWGAAAGATVVKAAGSDPWGTPVRGYQTEMEHFAFLVRKWDQKKGWAKKSDGTFEQEVPRCHGEVAMADAIIAHVANLAMKNKTRIEFEENWFKAESPDNPEAKYGGKTA